MNLVRRASRRIRRAVEEPIPEGDEESYHSDESGPSFENEANRARYAKAKLYFRSFIGQHVSVLRCTLGARRPVIVGGTLEAVDICLERRDQVAMTLRFGEDGFEHTAAGKLRIDRKEYHNTWIDNATVIWTSQDLEKAESELRAWHTTNS